MNFLQRFSEIILDIIWNQLILSVVLKILWKETHFISLPWVTNTFKDQKSYNLVSQLNIWNLESIMTRIITTLIFISSTFPIVSNILLIQNLVFLNGWIKLSGSSVLHLLAGVERQELKHFILRTFNSCINDILIIIKLDEW